MKDKPDLSAIDWADLRSEIGRRNAARRKTMAGGRPPKPTACKKCGKWWPSYTEARQCRHPGS